jgi:WD40 repeat protein
VWSVDFSIVDPTKLVSGSDDGSVKLWDMNQAILFLHLLYVSFLTNDNMVIELVCGLELLLFIVITHFL